MTLFSIISIKIRTPEDWDDAQLEQLAEDVSTLDDPIEAYILNALKNYPGINVYVAIDE